MAIINPIPRGSGGNCSAKICTLLLALFVACIWPERAAGYSVLAHEAIIDSSWDTTIRPLLLRFYQDPDGQYGIKMKRKQWARVQEELTQLQAIHAESISKAPSGDQSGVQSSTVFEMMDTGEGVSDLP